MEGFLLSWKSAETGDTKQEESDRHFGAGLKSISMAVSVVGVTITVGKSLAASWAVKVTFVLCCWEASPLPAESAGSELNSTSPVDRFRVQHTLGG